MTGSASKDRSKYYHYDHCQPPCKFRIKADEAEKKLVEKLEELTPHPAMIEVYKKIVEEVNRNQSQHLSSDRRKFLDRINNLNSRLNKARELLLTGAIEPDDYKLMKADIEEKINREEAELSASNIAVRNIQKLLNDACDALSKLDRLYIEGDVKQKREIIGSIFPKKLVFEETGYRTPEVNDAVHFIYLINK